MENARPIRSFDTNNTDDTDDTNDVPIAPLTLRVFGAFSLVIHGQEATGLSRAAQEVMTLLALRSEPANREGLAFALWPDTPRDLAFYYLRRSLTELRAALGEAKVRLTSPTRNTLHFDFSEVDCDVLTFTRLAGQSEEAALEQALACYRGPLLETSDAAWVLPERARLLDRYLAVLASLADIHEGRGNVTGATRLLRRAVEADVYREATQRRLLQTLGNLGDYPAVEKQFRELRRHLHSELNMVPSAETMALYHALRAQGQADPSPRANLAYLPSSNQRLPCPLTSLIGRTRDREEVRAALQSGRLVTLTGPGGVGKTRLAIAVAETIVANYPDGVAFVDLAPTLDGANLLHTVIVSLGMLPDSDLTSEETLRRFLCRKSLLLILDNAEHILAACARTAAFLLRECPSLHILCTSREPLRVPGERVWQVAPLETPPKPEGTKQSGVGTANLLAYEAAALLVERVAAAASTFRLSERNAAAIAQICRRLDGIPLALELAAARFRSLSAQEIAVRLEDCFRLLSSGSPALPRHQTLRATLDWSYGLLNEVEQRLLRQLSVFVGGWTLDAVEAICPNEQGVLPVLLSLVEKSLVVYEAQGDRERYRLLEMTREYAAERLTFEERAIQEERHAAFFFRMAQGAEIFGVESETRSWYIRLRADYDNLHAAHTWWQARDADTALWLEYFLYYSDNGKPSDWRTRIAQLQANPLPPSPLSLLVTHQVGCWAMWTGHPAREALLLRVVDTASACGEAKWKMFALSVLRDLEQERGNDLQALVYAEAALLSAREYGDIYNIARTEKLACEMLAQTGAIPEAQSRLRTMLEKGQQEQDWRLLLPALDVLGSIAFQQKDWEKARAYWEELLPLTQEYYPVDLPNQLRNLAYVAREQHDYPAAWQFLEQGITASRRNHAHDREGWTRWDMAEVAFRQGDKSLAVDYLRLCYAVFKDNEEPRNMAKCLRRVALYHKSEGRCEQAALILGSVERNAREQALSFPAEEQKALSELAMALRKTLGDEACQAAFGRGETLTSTEVEALAFSGEPLIFV